MATHHRHHQPPGTAKPRRWRPPLHWELLACGTSGHELIGTDAAKLRDEDQVFAREDPGGLRWYRCVRCDSWLPLQAPENPPLEFPPSRDSIDLPLRGKALRDKVVLRLIAIDRVFHFIVLGTLAVLVFLFAAKQSALRDPIYKLLDSLQTAFGGPAGDPGHGLVHEVRHLFALKKATLEEVGILVAAYALLEGAEAVGLWYAKRWAEYLTFIATTLLMPLEIRELIHGVTVFKVTALVINLAIVIYLLFAKRLFGLRGGGAAEEAERARDLGWPALERTAPATALIENQ
jgi:uncharacterized membrane protein (DUF2068 family)